MIISMPPILALLWPSVSTSTRPLSLCKYFFPFNFMTFDFLKSSFLMQEKTFTFSLSHFYLIILHSVHFLARDLISFLEGKEIPLICMSHILF